MFFCLHSHDHKKIFGKVLMIEPLKKEVALLVYVVTLNLFKSFVTILYISKDLFKCDLDSFMSIS